MPSVIRVTRGFDDFARGTLGDAGRNLYVSRAGVLQRIHHSDLDQDGHADLLFCNSQDHWERPPAYVYGDVFGEGGCLELPSDGSVTGTVADLNGDGHADLVLGMDYNGARTDLNAFVYYGSPHGLSEDRLLMLPAEGATSVAAGDFDGDGQVDLAFACRERLRVFARGELGYEPRRFTDLPITAGQLAVADLDGDGSDDLVSLTRSELRIYWGGPDGLSADRVIRLPIAEASAGTEDDAEPESVEYVRPVQPVARVVSVGGIPHVFAPGMSSFQLVSVTRDRGFGAPISVDCPHAISVAVGDVNGDGRLDLVVATRPPDGGASEARVYAGGEGGFVLDEWTALATEGACDLALGDLDGDGCDDIVICQDRTAASFTHEALVFRGGPDGIAGDPIRLKSHDARRVFIARTSDDAHPQVVLVNHRARGAQGDVDVRVYLGADGGPSAERFFPLQARDAVDAVCCDLTDDGVPEIVVANCSENAVDLDPGSFIFHRGAGGYAYEPDVALPTSRAHGVCCADVNHDGHLDLVFVGFNNDELLVFHGGPDGIDPANHQRLQMECEGETFTEPRWIELADLSNDGWLDLVVPQIGSDRSFILWGGPEGFSMERRQMLSVWHASCVQAADLTGNGFLDLIIGGHTPSLQGPHDSFVYVYWNGPAGLHEDRRTQLPANGVNAICVADFDRDGELDLFVSNYHDGRVRDISSFLYWGGEGGSFSASRCTYLPTHSASGCVAMDLNGNGWLDLAVAYHKVHGDHVGYSEVWWNGPQGFSEERVTKLPSEGPHGMVRAGFGNQSNRGPEEVYTSEAFELPAEAQSVGLEWDADVPETTWLRGELRFDDSADELANADWVEAVSAEGEKRPVAPAGRWAQYRLALGAINGGRTPRVTEARVVGEGA